MLNDWLNLYIFGDRQVLTDWQAEMFYDTETEEITIPGDQIFLCKKFLHPFKQTGTRFDEEIGQEVSVYSEDLDSTDSLIFAAVRADAIMIVDELAALPKVTVHLETPVEEIENIYPEFCLGWQVIPRITNIC